MILNSAARPVGLPRDPAWVLPTLPSLSSSPASAGTGAAPFRDSSHSPASTHSNLWSHPSAKQAYLRAMKICLFSNTLRAEATEIQGPQQSLAALVSNPKPNPQAPQSPRKPSAFTQPAVGAPLHQPPLQDLSKDCCGSSQAPQSALFWSHCSACPGKG